MAADNRLSAKLIRQAIRIALAYENVSALCEINVLVTDDQKIRDINREFRGIDAVTDVLSFPMQEFSPPGWKEPDACNIDPDSGLLPLGDIVFSAERLEKQAREHSQSSGKETAYLTVHSVLHLLGYDHVDEADEKKQMRAREKEIMKEIVIT